MCDGSIGFAAIKRILNTVHCDTALKYFDKRVHTIRFAVIVHLEQNASSVRKVQQPIS